MDPISRSTYGFCQGLDGLETTSVMLSLANIASEQNSLTWRSGWPFYSDGRCQVVRAIHPGQVLNRLVTITDRLFG